MGIDRPSRHGCHPKRSRRPNLDPTIDQILPFIDGLLDKLQIDLEQFELYDEGRWGDGIDPQIQSLSKSMFFGLPLPEKPRDHFQVRLTRYKQRYNPATLLPWALEGARNIEEKINRLGSLLDDLEDIVIAVHDTQVLTRASFSTARQSTSSDTQPPPYSAIDYALQIPEPNTSLGSTSHGAVNPTDVDPNRQGHYLSFKRYLVASLVYREHSHPLPLIEESLGKICDLQLQELRTDVHDELIRRQLIAFGSPGSSSPSIAIPSSLPSCPCFSPTRKKARHALSKLPKSYFGDLISDIVLELERRFPSLKADQGLGIASNFSQCSVSLLRLHSSESFTSCACSESDHAAPLHKDAGLHISTRNQGDRAGLRLYSGAWTKPLPELVDARSSTALSSPPWPAPPNTRAFPFHNLI